MKELPTPQELAMQVLGEIPEGTPETWGDVTSKLEYITGKKGEKSFGREELRWCSCKPALSTEGDKEV